MGRFDPGAHLFFKFYNGFQVGGTGLGSGDQIFAGGHCVYGLVSVGASELGVVFLLYDL